MNISLFEKKGSMATIRKPAIRSIMVSNLAGPESTVYKVCAPINNKADYDYLIEQCREFVRVSHYVALMVTVGDRELFAYGKDGREYMSRRPVHLPETVCVKIFDKDNLSMPAMAKMLGKIKGVEAAVLAAKQEPTECKKDLADFGTIAVALRQAVDNVKNMRKEQGNVQANNGR